MIVPNWDTARQQMQSGKNDSETALASFVFYNEPTGSEAAEDFNDRLQVLVDTLTK